jgi:RNA polymerase sigma-70 factor (ECF subfamily)
VPDARLVASVVEEAHRQHWSAVLAATVRLTRDLDLAEDCAQDAFLKALSAWPQGIPDNPAAWLTTVARRVALDRLRRETTLRRKLPMLAVEAIEAVEAVEATDQPDGAVSGDPDFDQPADLLRLVFTCCHPALAPDSRIALTLRLMCGLTTAEVAGCLLIKEATAAARITRAKKKIAAAKIPFRIPSADELPPRLDAVLTVVHLVYTAGHTASGAHLRRTDLTGRAMDLARMLVRLMPDEPEAAGLMALLLLTEARGESRLGQDGELVLLADQDRDRWDGRLIAQGIALGTRALERGEGRFALQAAIAGLHAIAPSWDTTDWRQVARMYDALMARWPSPVVALNRVAARSFEPEADLPALLDELDLLAYEPALHSYCYLPATRADVLWRLGRGDLAAREYDAALALSVNEAERRFLQRRKAALIR